MKTPLKENAALGRFELALDEQAVAAVYYRVEDGAVVLAHTEVPLEFAGQGIATRMADAIFPIFRARGQQALPRCEFMVRYMARHPEFDDLLIGEPDSDCRSCSRGPNGHVCRARRRINLAFDELPELEASEHALGKRVDRSICLDATSAKREDRPRSPVRNPFE
ncbi:GNAT family N-acetyltransferase [Rhizobium grahamii]|uniref:N-acetyltransferase domain-containing protein n=1 Tax=Rhizobium grahamii TaxID=1120045 RepID=A0A370KTF9_9HYPH|nr:hypothetical protein B5K06_08275 [Rhizobium grahamii]